MKKDTVRLILFLECNMRCKYCCNEQEQFSSQFIKKDYNDIDFSQYANICISGGEPFLHKFKLFDLLDEIDELGKPFFIYTNALQINSADIELLLCYDNLKCINIGLHTLKQLKAINPYIEKALPVRFMAQDIYCDELLKLYPSRLNSENLKGWTLNECNMPNEDWILLK